MRLAPDRAPGALAEAASCQALNPAGAAAAGEQGTKDWHAEWFDFILGAVGDAVCVIDEHATLRYANEACCRLFGYPAEELLRLPATALVDWSAQAWAQCWQELTTAQAGSSFRGHAQTRDGRVVPVEMKARHGSYGGQVCALVVARDAGLRREAMDELRQREHVLESSPDVIIRYDLELRRIYANPRFEQLNGLAPEQYLGKKPSELSRISAQVAATLEDNLRAALRAGEPQQFDFEWRAASDALHWHSMHIVVERDAQGQPASLLTIATDITARKRAEQALAVREREFRSLAENAGVNIIRWDPQGRARYVNPMMERTLGLPAGTMLGRTPPEIFPGDTFTLTHRAVLEVARSGEASTIEQAVLEANGRTYVHQIQLAPERDAAGAVVGVIGIGQDITERKRLEDAWQFITQRGWGEDGEPFFPALVDYLGRTLQLDYVFVDTLDDEQPGIAETVARYALGEVGPNLRYELKDTPCERVASRTPCAYREGIQQLFPRSRQLVEMQAESYVGVPLLDGAGRAIGLLVVMDRRPLVDLESITSVLRLVATRVGAELMRDRTDKALQASEREFRSLAENSPDFIVRYDLQARALYVNPAVLERLNVAPEFLVGKTPSQGALPGHEAAMAEQERLIRGVLRGEGPAEMELVLSDLGRGIEIHHTRFVPVKSSDGRIDGALAIGRDVSERKRAEVLLGQREREFRLLVENSPDYVIRYDIECRIRYCSPIVERTFGDAVHAWIGKTPVHAMPAAAQGMAELEVRLRGVLAGNAPEDFEFPWVDPSGVPRVSHTLLAAERDADGAVTGVIAVGRDITDRKRAEDLLRRHEQEFRALVEHSPDLIERYDRQGRRVYANPALSALLLGSPAMSAQPECDGMVVAEVDQYLRMVQTVIATGQPQQAELRYHRADGSAGWLDARLCPESDGEGGVASVLVVARDISQGVEQRERIQTLALSDPLTRLHNRQALYDYAPGLISEARRHGRKLGVMILDVDRFKDVNDTLGHAAGDALLCEVAQRIAGCTRGSDLLVRLGGDEFAIVATNLGDEIGMATVADKIDKALTVPLLLGGRQVVVSASIGIALFPADGDQLEDLMAHADTAMYQAKRGGRCRYEFYRPEFSERARDRIALEHALRDAQDGAGLELYYQPLVALSDGRPVGAEALLRWHHPELGLLAPDRFIAIAEETGLIVPIGRWVIAEAARTAQRWNQGRTTPLKVAVNVSTRQFLRDDVAAVVREALRDTGCKPQWLGIEVTESLLLEDGERIQNTLHELRTIGLQIAIDDFGTGYSALNYLSKFDVSCLKIDRQFVHDIDTDPRQAELIKAFIAIARALRLSVVAEGVETPAQAAFLREQGCEVGQGFLFCRPTPAERLEQDLREGRWGPEEFALV